MWSIGFIFAHMNAHEERLRGKNNQWDKKSMQRDKKGSNAIQHGSNKKVHPQFNAQHWKLLGTR